MTWGPDGFLARIADPFWFQALGCLLGFDWHSSGLTTTTCGALKEGLRGRAHDLGLHIAGGKGAASRKTPDEIRAACESSGLDAEALVYASRMSAKVDSAAVQDGFQIYHHCFMFTASGRWAVVQQGMNEDTGWARRYHWLGRNGHPFVCDPHAAICSDGTGPVVNLVAAEASDSRTATAAVSRLPPEALMRDLRHALAAAPHLDLPARHRILRTDIHPDRLAQTFLRTYARQPETFETLLGLPGVGPQCLRALSLLGQLLYGAAPSFRDPARFSFAHGGKDGIPFPVDRQTYDTTATVLERAVRDARLGQTESLDALRRLERYWNQLDARPATPLAHATGAAPHGGSGPGQRPFTPALPRRFPPQTEQSRKGSTPPSDEKFKQFCLDLPMESP